MAALGVALALALVMTTVVAEEPKAASLIDIIDNITMAFDRRFQRRNTNCYEHLGCFSNSGDFFHPLYRPLSVAPQSPERVATTFHLYTRENPREPQQILTTEDGVIDWDRLDKFNPANRFVFIVHGYIDSWKSGWHRRMTRELLTREALNVVVVDWKGGNRWSYAKATANTRIVGAEIARFINYLQDKKGIDPGTMHIIGHSLGSHVAGYAGERVKGLGRITGLDPAGPNFYGMPPIVRLDPTDAKRVDTIVTNGRPGHDSVVIGFGMQLPCGHVNFYPNGGHMQPGCPVEQSVNDLLNLEIQAGVRNIAACSHLRSIEYFIESINPPPTSRCEFTSFKCDSFEDFVNGRCVSCGADNAECNEMGMDAVDPRDGVAGAETQQANYYTFTSNYHPYCAFNYRVNMTFGDRRARKGIVEIAFNSTGRNSPSTYRLKTKDGSSYNVEMLRGVDDYLLQVPDQTVDMSRAALQWKRSDRGPNSVTIDTITIKPMAVEPIEKAGGSPQCLVLTQDGRNRGIREGTQVRFAQTSTDC